MVPNPKREKEKSALESDDNTFSFLQLIISDLDRASREAGGSRLLVFLTSLGFWAIFSYRIRHVWHNAAKSRLSLKVKTLGCGMVNAWTESATGITLPGAAEIGPGLFIPHAGPIILNPNVRIGSFCLIHQGVTLGTTGAGPKNGSPRIGNRVFIGANAVVIGKINVGDDAVIGAGAIVVKDVPAYAVVAGNPATIVSRRGSFELIHYNGMDEDPSRAASLGARPADGEAEHCLK